MSTDSFRLGFIGCGHMGLAIAKGAVHSQVLKPEEISVFDPNPAVNERCRDEGFELLKDGKEVIRRSRVVLLAVTPQACDAVLEQLKGTKPEALLSIVTGASIRYLQQTFGNVPVIRAMPNTPLQVGYGSTALCRSRECPEEVYAFVRALFEATGVVCEIPEERMNEMVCVHGSIPAYVYYLTECILQDMVARGHDEAATREMLVQTVIGSGKLMQAHPEKPLQAFIDEVCSKGGTTIEAVGEMRAGKMDRIIHEADEKCIRRANELSKE